MEPALHCVAAFHSAETGIIDSHRLMLALQGDLEDRGGVIAFNTPIERVAREGGRLAGRVRRAGGRRDRGRRRGQFGRPRRAAPRRRDRRLSGRAGAQAGARQGQLLRPDLPRAVLPPDLSGAGAGRARHPHHHRSRRPGAVRAGRRMGRGDELRRRSAPRRIVLRRDPHLLARPARQFAGRRLCRHPAEADRARASPPPIS